MRGPGLRLDIDVRRVWRCPVCRQERKLLGHVTTVRCECRPGGTHMQLVGERIVQPRPVIQFDPHAARGPRFDLGPPPAPPAPEGMAQEVAAAERVEFGPPVEGAVVTLSQVASTALDFGTGLLSEGIVTIGPDSPRPIRGESFPPGDVPPPPDRVDSADQYEPLPPRGPRPPKQHKPPFNPQGRPERQGGRQNQRRPDRPANPNGPAPQAPAGEGTSTGGGGGNSSPPQRQPNRNRGPRRDDRRRGGGRPGGPEGRGDGPPAGGTPPADGGAGT